MSPDSPADPTPIKAGSHRIVLFVVLLLIGAWFLHSPEGVAKVMELRDWIGNQGAAGPPVFILLFAIAVAAGVPWSAITVFSGALFPTRIAIPCVSIGGSLGAGLAFLIARYFLGHGVIHSLKTNEAFSRLNELTHRRGALVVAITRLIPILPANLLNYLYGLTRIPFPTFLFWTWVATFPEVVVLVLGGHVCSRAMISGHIAWNSVAIMVAIGVLLMLLGRMAWGLLNAPVPDEIVLPPEAQSPPT